MDILEKEFNLVYDEEYYDDSFEEDDYLYEEEINENECQTFEFAQNGDIVKQYIYDISEYPVLTKSEESNLFKEYNKTKDIKLKNKIVTSNLKFVVYVAKRYLKYCDNDGQVFLDLIQEGNEALIKAVDKFDYKKKYKFSTYSYWWIKQAIIHSISEKRNLIKLPRQKNELKRKIQNYKEKVKLRTGSEPTILEISQELSLSVSETREIMVLCDNECISIDLPVGTKKDTPLCELIDSGELSIEQNICDKYSKIDLINFVKETLDERLFKIVSYRVGFINEFNPTGEILTLKQLGEKMNLSIERVRSLERKAYLKLKGASIKYKIKTGISIRHL